MTRRKKHDIWDRLGMRLADIPAGQRFGLSLFVVLAFCACSLVLVNLGASIAADKIDPPKPTADPSAGLGFDDLVIKTTGAAYSAFFDLSLSRINFISNYETQRTAGDREWEYTFWELWVPNDFDFERARQKFVEKLAKLGPTVHTEVMEVDAKVLRLNVDIEGLNTHRIFLTRTAVEAEKDSEPTFALADIESAPPPAVMPKGSPRVALIIDDIGYRDLLERQFLELDARLTFSILPHSPFGTNFSGRARQRSREVMLHLPMEPKDKNILPGQGGLFIHMSDAEIRQTATGDLDDVPGAVGVNNHMGSRFTSDEAKMAVVLELVKNRGLYFVDSRTAGSSRAYEVARRMGLRTGVRNVFLDHNPEYDAVIRQLDVLLAFARKNGTAIAIGHPHDSTLKALKAKLPEFARAGVQLVPPSELVK